MYLTTLVWPMIAAMCLTFGLIHLFMWIMRRSRFDFLLFAFASFSVAAIAGFEMRVMTADTVAQYAFAVRWAHVPVFVLLVSLMLFVRYYLGTGRLWLMWMAIGARGITLVVSFAVDVSVNYAEIIDVSKVTIWGGEQITIATFRVHPFSHYASAISLLVIAFLIDAAITAWRRGQRRNAILIPGSAVIFIVGATFHGSLIHAGWLTPPYLISVAYMAVLITIAYEMCRNLVDAARVAEELAESRSDLNESEQLLDLGATAAGLGFWHVDLDDDGVWVSEQGRVLLGLKHLPRLTRQDVIQAFHPHDQQQVMQVINDAASHGSDFVLDVRVGQAEGLARWVCIHGRAERPMKGSHRIKGVILDITMRKKAELEAEISRNEIAQLSRMKLLGVLSGAIAHELNQPLTAILSNAQAGQLLLNRDPTDIAELKEILADIITDDKRAGQIIQNLRQFLRTGKTELQPINLVGLITTTVDHFRIALINRGVTCIVQTPPAPLVVDADAIQLQQVLLNLIFNACDAMEHLPESERRLFVASSVNQDGDAQVTVTDCGHGIPENQLEASFDPFVTTKQSGMGLGLAISRAIIDAHGGRIWAERGPDAGARVCFTLKASGGQQQ